ncbi:MAG: 50S ribosomal protein L10 [Planctomycetaceae bacterium]
MSKPIKQLLIDEITSRMGEHRDMLVIDVSRLDAISANKFRIALAEKSITALTVKNSLARKALEGVGVESLDGILAGPSTLVWGGEDVVALSKEIAKWAKDFNEVEIKGATVEGETLDSAGVDALAKSPGREELLSIISGQLIGPGAQLASQLLGPGGQLAGQIKSKSEDDE